MTAQAATTAPIRKALFNPATAAALLIVGLIAFVAIFAGSAFDTGPREDLDGGTHALSKSAVGYAGAVALLKSMNRPVVVARGPVTGESADRSTLIVTLDGNYDGSLLSEPTITRFNGPVLVVLPKWAVTSGGRIGWVRKAGIDRLSVERWLLPRERPANGEAAADKSGMDYDEAVEARQELRRAMRRAAEEASKTTKSRAEPRLLVNSGGEQAHSLWPADELDGRARVTTGVIDRWQTFGTVPGWRRVLADENGRAILLQYEDEERHPLFVLSEPDLINTHGLSDLKNARALAFVLEKAVGDSALVFDVSMHGFERSRSFLREAFEPPFLGATLCTLATLALMIWHAFFRFGRAREASREFALGKRALADNQADLIKMAGRERLMGDRYGAMIRDLAGRAVGAPKDLTPEQLEAFLDRLGDGGRTSWPLSTLRRDIAAPKDSAELVRAAERLHHWRVEMTRERGPRVPSDVQ